MHKENKIIYPRQDIELLGKAFEPRSKDLEAWMTEEYKTNKKYPEYVSHACRKMKTYCDNGIIPSINLIMTYETNDCPIGMERIEQIVEYYFG